MTITRTRTQKVITRTAAVVAAGCAAFPVAGPAAADTSFDQPTGEAADFCSTTAPFTCDPTHLNLTVPPDANAIKIDFTPNPNPCPDLAVSIFEGITPHPLGQSVAITPGDHSFTILPSCSQQLGSWGGNLHVTYITPGGGDQGTGAATQTATVKSESDVYDAPSGNNRIEAPFFLAVGSQFKTVQPCADGWCLLAIPNLPGGAHANGTLPAGQGWVYEGGNGDTVRLVVK